MDVTFLEDGSVEFIVSKDRVSMLFRIAQPFKYGIDKWRLIRNGGTGEIRYEGCKMPSTPSNMTLIFYESVKPSRYQWVRLFDGILELGIELERGDKKRYSKSSIQIPLPESFNAIDKLIDHYEKV
jgi:hypothetical protein